MISDYQLNKKSETKDTIHNFTYYKYRGIKFRYSSVAKNFSIEPYYCYYTTEDVVKKIINNHLDKQKYGKR